MRIPLPTWLRVPIGLLSIVPFAGMCVTVYGFLEDGAAALYLGLIVSGLVDTGLAAVFIPHVHDNPRIGKDWKILWIALLGIPYITVAPLYWLIYILPEKERPAEVEGPLGQPCWRVGLLTNRGRSGDRPSIQAEARRDASPPKIPLCPSSLRG